MRGPAVPGVVAALAAAALAVLGIQAPAAIAQPAPPDGAGADPGVAYRPVCDTAKPGEFACFALRRTDVAPARGLRPAAIAPAGFGPADLQGAYSLPVDGGAGQTVAVVDAYDDPTAEADLAVYRAQYGLPPCTTDNGCFTKADQRGGTQYPVPDTGWAGEISLDLDMVSAVAPNAHILLVEADDSSDVALGASVDEAVTLGAKYVSNSYGTDYRPGDGEDPSETTTLDAHYNHPGVAVVASSGDFGFGVSYPAASQYVTSVGGTALTRAPGSARGWSESAWTGAGSGCSLYEPKPAFQQDTGCANRSIADVSAVADPATGVAVYQTTGGGGWAVYGGTSVSSPIIAGVYADAGTPAAGSYPNAYPYAAGTGLNDVTTGTNGICTPDYLCRGAAGYDGPTGLGTPNGLQAFRTGPQGRLSGTVTDHATGRPLPGVTVSDGSDVAHTDAQGAYALTLPAGSHDLTITAFGYATDTEKDVTVTENTTLTKNFALTQVPSETVSGTVADGSGHRWPLYAKITVDGDPNAVWTDPVTGRYKVTLPRDSDFTLHIAATSPGYGEVTKLVHVGSASVRADVAAVADPWVATAPGYSVRLTGSTEAFDAADSAPQGWSVTNAPGTDGGWRFDDPADRGNDTGGSGAFAIADSNYLGFSSKVNTFLASPVYDFTGKTRPEVGFSTMYLDNPYRETFEVEASDDGGATWSTVWEPDLSGDAYFATQLHLDVPLTAFAGKPAVQLRFHYTANGAWYWGVDDVFVGQRDYLATPGGMVVGRVTDANTGTAAVDATVTDRDDPSAYASTVATPTDPNLGDGFFSLFVPGPGRHVLTAGKFHYADEPQKVRVRADDTVAQAYGLKAGRLKVSPGAIDASVGWGGHATRQVKITNTGSAPATLLIGEQSGPGGPGTPSGAPLERIAGDYPLGRVPAGRPASAHPGTTVPAADPWQSGPALPEVRMDNVADSYNGTIYSAFGDTGLVIGGDSSSAALYALDPVGGAWTRLANATDPRQAPGHGIIDGKLYAAGGWGSDTTPDPKLEIYDTATDRWTTGAPEPTPYAAAGSAVLDGKLYLVGGCDTSCGTTDVSVYDAATDTWSRTAPYPEPVSWASCGGIAGKVYCAGGATESGGEIRHAYVYDPAAGTWSALPDMPLALWGAAYATADGLLVVSSGVTSGGVLTNQGVAYDPKAGTWSWLPNAGTATYRGAGAPGFYKLGGSTGGIDPSTVVENLPGYAVDPTADVPWLGESTTQLTVRPGRSAVVTISLNAHVAEITQPGDYSGRLVFGSSTPYPLPAATVTLHVAPARSRSTAATRG